MVFDYLKHWDLELTDLVLRMIYIHGYVVPEDFRLFMFLWPQAIKRLSWKH